MPETILEIIDYIRHTNPDLNALDLDEESVKQVIVLPLLKAAGWDTLNREEVMPAPIGYPVVDYRLRLDSSNQVFVEVKNSGEDLDDWQNQLLRYRANGEGRDVKLSVLTNGREWWLYLPTEKRRNIESW